MKLLDKTKFSFITATKQVFLFTGPTDNPTEVYTVTAQLHEVIIGLYLTGPGVITAPDGTKFMLELVMLPALQAAKQRLLNESQAKIEAANARVQAEMPEDISWLADLTDADKEFMRRVIKARNNGQRVSYRYPPFAVEVKFGPMPKKPKKPKLEFPEPAIERGDLKWNEDKSGVDFVPNPEGKSFFQSNPGMAMLSGLDYAKANGIDPYDSNKLAPFHNDEMFTQQQTSPIAEQVPVVVLTVPESDSQQYIIERRQWDAYAAQRQIASETWRDGALRIFCADANLSPDDITAIDFDQTRTREELDKLPDFQF